MKSKITDEITILKESEEQKLLFKWASYQLGKYPELKTLFHIPNGGSRNVREAVNLKAQGVKRGVPDLFLPVARGNSHGLFIEMKRIKGGRISAEQSKWIESLAGQGYEVAVCKGCDSAIDIIIKYLERGD